MPSVKRTRLRSSGTLPMFAKPEKKAMGTLRGRRGAEQLRLAARLLDLGGRSLGERVRGDDHGLGQVAVAEDLDLVALTFDEAALAERLLVDLRASGEDLEIAHVDLGGLGRERRVEAALREAALHRRLTAFEVQLEAARTRVLPLLA